MSRILDRSVPARLDGDGRPVGFRWDGAWHRVVEVQNEWIYREPWWDKHFAGSDPGEAPERIVYRVRTDRGAVCELSVRARVEARLYRMFD